MILSQNLQKILLNDLLYHLEISLQESNNIRPIHPIYNRVVTKPFSDRSILRASNVLPKKCLLKCTPEHMWDPILCTKNLVSQLRRNALQWDSLQMFIIFQSGTHLSGEGCQVVPQNSPLLPFSLSLSPFSLLKSLPKCRQSVRALQVVRGATQDFRESIFVHQRPFFEFFLGNQLGHSKELFQVVHQRCPKPHDFAPRGVLLMVGQSLKI